MNDATRKGVSQAAFGSAPAKSKIDESNVTFDNDLEGADDIQATSTDVEATSTTEGDVKGKARNPRDDLIDGMHARIEATRRQERAEAGIPEPEATEIVADEDEPEGKPQAKSAEVDPLAAFMVLKDGKPMFRTVINGKEQLIPMERARDQLQKAEAAEVRMARAAEAERVVKARENQLLANEQALATRLRGLPNPPSDRQADEGHPLSEGEILKEADELVSALFTGTREQAAAKLAKTLADTRRAVAVPTINPREIGQQAVKAAKEELSREATEKDVATGFKQFGEDYPEILADEGLFRYADGMTDAIAAENPSWTPSKVMLEAGKKTKEWIESLKSPGVTPPGNNRQSRKDGLVPIPRATNARREPGVVVDADAQTTPSSTLAEIRKARGQA